MDPALDFQGRYETVLRSHSAIIDRIIAHFERGELPSETDMRQELELRIKLDLAIAAWYGTPAKGQC